jgi:hypothetical protein
VDGQACLLRLLTFQRQGTIALSKQERKEKQFIFLEHVRVLPPNKPSLAGTFWFVVVSWGTLLSIDAPHSAARKSTFDF